MPYTKSNLPSNVQKLDDKQQRQWMHIMNGCLGDGKPESKCFAMANGVVKGKDLTDDEAVAVVEAKQYQYLDSWDVQDRQLSQDAANYNPLGATNTEGCANCQWFIAPSRCVVVAGEISPTGHSDQWMAKVPYTPPPLLVQIVNADDDAASMGSGDQTGVAGENDYPGVSTKATGDGGDAGDELVELAESEFEYEALLAAQAAMTLDLSVVDGEKATLTAAQRKRIPKSACGYVDDNGKCHFPLNDAAHVRNAAARLGNSNFSSAIKAQIRRKIIAAAKRFKINTSLDSSSKDADALAGSSSWRERALSAVKSALLGVTDEPQRSAHPPVLSEGHQFSLVRQKDNRLRFFAAWSNNFEDREGETFPESAHKEFIAWADENEQYPELWIWHTKGTKYGQVDWLDYTDGFVYASGLIDDGYEALAEQLSKEDTGVSHGFAGIQRGKEIIQYRSWEISTLPRANAAVWTTSFNVIGEGAKNMGFTQQKKDYLIAHGLTAEQVTAAEVQATALQKSLRELGISWKDADLEDPPQSTGTPQNSNPLAGAAADSTSSAGAPDGATSGDKAATDFQKDILAALQKNTEALAVLAGSVKSIDERVKAVEKTDDEKIAAALTGRPAVGSGVQASKSTDNVVATQPANAADKDWFNSQFLAGLGAATTAS